MVTPERRPIPGWTPSAPFFGSVSSVAAFHIATALFNHAKECRRLGIPIPTEVDTLARFFGSSAREGQRGPEFDSADGVSQGEDMPTVATELEPQALSYTAAASRLSVSVRTVKRLVAEQRLPVVRVGTIPRIHVADLDQYLADQRSVTPPKASSKSSTSSLPKGA